MARKNLDTAVQLLLGPHIGRALRMDKFPFAKQTRKITKEEFQAELVNLLKEFPYPYPQTRKLKTTMFG
jgi:hypothetical protein